MSLTLDIEALQSKASEVATLDEKLDAASDSENAGKIALTNQLVKEHEDVWKPVSDQLNTAIETELGTNPETLAASYNGILRSLREKFKKTVEEYIVARVEENKTETDESAKVSQEEYDAWMTERRELVKQFQAMKEVMELVGMDVDSVTPPKKRTGAPRGKRGPRTFTNYQFSIDGKPRAESSNSLSSIAGTVTKDLNWRVNDLHNFLTENDIDLQNPPESFEVTLPNGKVLSGVRQEVPEGSVSDEEPEEDEDSGEEE